MIPKSVIKKIQNKKPFYKKNVIHNLFCWKDLSNILNIRPYVNNTRFHVLSDASYSWEMQGWLSDVNSYPPTLLYNLVNNHSCYFSDASRVNENVNNICKELENALQYPTDAHIYFAASDNCTQGFPIHWDWSHNFIVQTEGQTNFKVWNIIADVDSNRLADSLPEKPILDVIMEPGDVIFVPERVYHQAISLTKRMSISFPSNPHETLQPQDRYWINL